MEAEKLSISLPADMARWVRLCVEKGAYASNSEVIRAALRLLEESEAAREERLASVRSRIADAAQNPERIPAGDLARHFDEVPPSLPPRN